LKAVFDEAIRAAMQPKKTSGGRVCELLWFQKTGLLLNTGELATLLKFFVFFL
jgi:hypothetical protein